MKCDTGTGCPPSLDSQTFSCVIYIYYSRLYFKRILYIDV